MSTCRPMIFSGPMVCALLAGRKCQTRRLVKLNVSGRISHGKRQWHPDDPQAVMACPYGVLGDTLWVRETWCEAHPLAFQEGRVGHRLLYAGIPGPPPVDYLVAYRADGELLPIWYSTGHPYRQLTPPDDLDRELFPAGVERDWKSPIFMPRKVSRILLRITDIRVERLMAISEAAAIAEGFRPLQSQEPGPEVPLGEHYTIQSMGEYISAAGAFLLYWDQLHGEGAMLDNPLVWVISFSQETP